MEEEEEAEWWLLLPRLPLSLSLTLPQSLFASVPLLIPERRRVFPWATEREREQEEKAGHQSSTHFCQREKWWYSSGGSLKGKREKRVEGRFYHD